MSDRVKRVAGKANGRTGRFVDREYKMKTAKLAGWIVALAFTLTASAGAQAPGNHLIYGLSGPVYSAAYVDASVLSGSDICAQINHALASSLPATGGVIDARGINATNPNSNLTCAASPWSTGVNTPATILLPAGTIQISNTWVLPNSTAIVGEGSSLTTILALSSTVNPIIQMGAAPPACPGNVCTGVSIQDLTLSGGGFAVNGIVNNHAQELSYASHINLFQILGTGLQIVGHPSSGAHNSGPYSDINFDTQAKAATATTVCAQILGAMPTRGIHGLTCVSNGTPNTAVLLDSSNTSIEDVHISGFQDGVLVGANSSAQGDVLLNIAGDSGVANVVHIANVPANGVSDLNLVAIGNAGGAVNTIRDDQTATTLSDAVVGMYALGEPVLAGGQIIGFSRFTTSTSANAATWATGTSAIPANTSCAARGSLYSNARGTHGGKNTWYVCTGTGTNNSWVNID
jgi:hypothetical protein